MFTRAFVVSLLAGLLVIGCSSNKPKNNQDDGAATASTNPTNNGLNLEMNGSSDASTAGGLQTVFFDFDSSTLDGSTKDTMKSNADFLKANTTVDVQVEGHCDERGGRQYNLALGERRAKAVRDYLVGLGVEAKRVSVVSYGNERPAAEGHDESAWGKNRRANFVITAK